MKVKPGKRCWVWLIWRSTARPEEARMEQLSELDASLLYLEHEDCPLHTGGVYLFEAPEGTDPLTFDQLREHLASRIQSTRRFRQRIVEVPFNLDHPYWADDPNFNLDNHLIQVTLDQPVTLDALLPLAEARQTQRLERDRPLWDVVFVDSHADGNRHTGLIVRTHQAIINGATGEELMTYLLDFTPESRRPARKEAWQPAPLPSRTRLLGQAYANALNTPARLAGMARDTVASAVHSVLMQRLKDLPLPFNLFTAPKTAFNQPVTAARALDTAILPLERLKRIKAALPPANLNDVLLSIVAEVAREELRAQGEQPTAPLTAMSPVSVRSKRLESPTGSQLTALIVSLDTHIDDMAERTLSIHGHAQASEIYSQAIAAARLTHLVPSALMGLAARVYSEFQLAQKHRPLFNLPVTNIPGPTRPLYLLGQPLVQQVACAPLYDGLASAFVFVSDASKVTLSVTWCPDTVHFEQPLQSRVDTALARLEASLQHQDADALWQEVQSRHASLTSAGWFDDLSRLFTNLLDVPQLRKLYERARSALNSAD
ncbi:MAG: wax ester/triacylglycerol synthase family O-acyltransferase [Gammaproteobacteria bacterium]|nr:MAG: wax ester/triacylglycerol synthase family O-acyltransferase [Gammaproteobacteria bacterium]